MKNFLFFLFLAISFPVFSQTIKAEVNNSASLIEGEFDRVSGGNNIPAYYLNPKGNWKSSSGNSFYIIDTPDGFLYQNTSTGDKFIAYSTVYKNFYSSNFYYFNNNQFAFSQFYTIIDNNTIRVDKTTGESFIWRRY